MAVTSVSVSTLRKSANGKVIPQNAPHDTPSDEFSKLIFSTKRRAQTPTDPSTERPHLSEATQAVFLDKEESVNADRPVYEKTNFPKQPFSSFFSPCHGENSLGKAL